MTKRKLEMAFLVFAGVAATPLFAKAVMQAPSTDPRVAVLRDGESRYRPGEPRTPTVRGLIDSESRYRPEDPRR